MKVFIMQSCIFPEPSGVDHSDLVSSELYAGHAYSTLEAAKAAAQTEFDSNWNEYADEDHIAEEQYTKEPPMLDWTEDLDPPRSWEAGRDEDAYDDERTPVEIYFRITELEVTGA